jgi:hypothetical protein
MTQQHGAALVTGKIQRTLERIYVTENHYRLSGALAPAGKTRRLLCNIKSEALSNRIETCELVRALVLNFARNADKTVFQI